MTPDGPPVPGEPQYSLHGLDPPSFVRSGVWCRNSNCRPNFRPVLLPCPAFLRSGSRNPQLESTIAVVGLVGATNAAEPTPLANASIGCTWRAARSNGVILWHRSYQGRGAAGRRLERQISAMRQYRRSFVGSLISKLTAWWVGAL
jgi:hypothetical protein